MEKFIDNWYLLTAVFLSGAFFYALNQNYFKKIFNKFTNKAPLIKKIWLFVMPFMIITTLIFIWIILKVEEKDKELYVSFFGQFSTLIFAIYAGYLAFEQLMENRIDKLREYADSYLSNKHYKRATEYYLELLKIKPTDYDSLANILEISLINGYFEKFDSQLPLLNKIALESSEELACKYLHAARYLFEEHNKKAKEKIDDIVNYVKNNPKSLQYFFMEF